MQSHTVSFLSLKRSLPSPLTSATHFSAASDSLHPFVKKQMVKEGINTVLRAEYGKDILIGRLRGELPPSGRSSIGRLVLEMIQAAT